jgi:hypothetical protein
MFVLHARPKNIFTVAEYRIRPSDSGVENSQQDDVQMQMPMPMLCNQNSFNAVSNACSRLYKLTSLPCINDGKKSQNLRRKERGLNIPHMS